MEEKGDRIFSPWVDDRCPLFKDEQWRQLLTVPGYTIVEKDYSSERRYGWRVRELGITAFWKREDNGIFLRSLRPRAEDGFAEWTAVYATPQAFQHFRRLGYEGVVNIGTEGLIEFKDRKIKVVSFCGAGRFYRFLEQKDIDAKVRVNGAA